MRAELLIGSIILVIGVLVIVFHRALHHFFAAERHVMGVGTAQDLRRPVVTALVGVVFVVFGGAMLVVQFVSGQPPASTMQDATLTKVFTVIAIVAGSLAVLTALLSRPLARFVARRLRKTGVDLYLSDDVDRYARGMVRVQFGWFLLIAVFCLVMAIVQPLRV
ncbi:hypothetical protein [Microbacterium sp. NPDC057650]|uniref:hypothetical protein n=1 Tax=unclassified Microbacterium TaxID=2609290 RepID=UPI0036723B14